MPERHSSAEYVTVDRARRFLDLTLPMLHRLVETGRVRSRLATDGRLRLAMDDLREVANTLDRAAFHALAADAGDGPLPEPWQQEAALIDRSWTGHKTERVWQGEREKWLQMGRFVPGLDAAGRPLPETH